MHQGAFTVVKEEVKNRGGEERGLVKYALQEDGSLDESSKRCVEAARAGAPKYFPTPSLLCPCIHFPDVDVRNPDKEYCHSETEIQIPANRLLLLTRKPTLPPSVSYD